MNLPQATHSRAADRTPINVTDAASLAPVVPARDHKPASIDWLCVPQITLADPAARGLGAARAAPKLPVVLTP